MKLICHIFASRDPVRPKDLERFLGVHRMWILLTALELSSFTLEVRFVFYSREMQGDHCARVSGTSCQNVAS